MANGSSAFWFTDPRKRGCEGTAGRAGGMEGSLRESGPRSAGVRGSRKKGLLLGKEVPLLLSWEQSFSFWDNKGIQGAKTTNQSVGATDGDSRPMAMFLHYSRASTFWTAVVCQAGDN